MPFDFQGRTVFVMGGTSGINLGIADAFARHGARVAVASRSQDKVDAAVGQLSAHGGEAAGFVADVREVEAVEQAFAGAHPDLKVPGPIAIAHHLIRAWLADEVAL